MTSENFLNNPEIMAFAVECASNAVVMERHACAELVFELAAQEDEGELSTALKNAAQAILDRVPEHRQ